MMNMSILTRFGDMGFAGILAFFSGFVLVAAGTGMYHTMKTSKIFIQYVVFYKKNY